MEKPGRLRAGDRAPDAPCVDGNGATRRLFEISSCRGVWATVSQASKSDPPLSIAELGTFDFREIQSSTMQTVYEAAGGREGLLKLAGAWHARVLQDDVVSHAFSHGYQPQHTERLAAY